MSNWKKLAIFGSSALLLAACGNNTDEGTEGAGDSGDTDEDQFRIAMVTDTGGVDDRSFNQSAWEGMNAWAEDNGFSDDTIHYVQSESEDQYIPNLNTATTDGYDIVYGIGFKLGI